MLEATPDQLVTLGAMISREWGETGYRVEEMHSYSSQVTAAKVRCSDGGRFIVMADRWGNTDSVSCEGFDSEAWDYPTNLGKAQELDEKARVA